MLEILGSIFERIQMLRSIEGVSGERVGVALQQHVKIFECFKKGLYSEPEQALCQHIQESKERYHQSNQEPIPDSLFRKIGRITCP